jgi:hypothetical protein
MQSCTQGCGDVGLSCSEEAMYNHVDDVDSSAKVAALIVAVGGEWSSGVECNGNYGTGENTPTWRMDQQGCSYRDGSASTLDTFNCSKTPMTKNGVIRHGLCYCVSPTITTPRPAAVTGDPHVTNVEGQRFNLVREGLHELLRRPRRSTQEPGGGALLEVVGSVETQRRCAEPFVRQLDLSGLWLQQSGPLVLRAGGPSEDTEDAIVL